MKKNCTRCKNTKELKQFKKEKRRKSGYAAICAECHNKDNKIYYAKNSEKCKASTMRWMRANPESNRNSVKKYQKKNPKKKQALTNAWHHRVKQATPKWLTKEQRKQIRDMYINKPEGYTVDHIIPLKGKKQMGLHVPWNLQYLTPKENSRKGNRGF